MKDMLVYHGSQEIVEYPEIRIAKYNKDFYYGFYCALYPEQAKRWAVRYNGHGIVNEYRYESDEDLKILKFDGMTEEWLDFIVACRLGKSHNYDIVEGPMANDTIFNYVQNFVDNKISREAFWALAKFNKPTHQISFHTVRALTTIKFLKGCDVVEALGINRIKKIYKYSDTLHCEPIEKVANDYIEMTHIAHGDYDNVAHSRYNVPDYWTIGEVYERLIEDVANDDMVDSICSVYKSWINDTISNYNSDFYYQPRDYIAECFREGKVL